jgi:hypothetical protein
MNRMLVVALSLAFVQAVSAQPDGIVPPDALDSEQQPSRESTTWSYASQGSDSLWASARSEQGTLGQYCNLEIGFCVWLLTLRGIECAHGDEHPVLMNTDRLAASHTIRCIGTVAGKGATFAFTNFDAVDVAVRTAQQLAIAVPEQGDAILIQHFPLAGATAALNKLRRALDEQDSGDGDWDGGGDGMIPSVDRKMPLASA